MNKQDLVVGMKIRHIYTNEVYEVSGIGKNKFLAVNLDGGEDVKCFMYLDKYEPYIEPIKREIAIRVLGGGNLSAGMEKLVLMARDAGIIDKKTDRTVETNYKRNPDAAKEDDIFN